MTGGLGGTQEGYRERDALNIFSWGPDAGRVTTRRVPTFLVYIYTPSFAPWTYLRPCHPTPKTRQYSQLKTPGAADGAEPLNTPSHNTDLLTTRPFGRSPEQPDPKWPAAQSSCGCFARIRSLKQRRANTYFAHHLKIPSHLVEFYGQGNGWIRGFGLQHFGLRDQCVAKAEPANSLLSLLLMMGS